MGPYRLLAIVLCLFAVGCGSSEPDPVALEAPTAVATETPAPTATPESTATASPSPTVAPTPAPTPEPTPAPTPEPTPVLVEAVCPDERDNAGDSYSYDPDAIAESAAVLENCGTLRATSGICPDGRRNAGDRYFYDPDDTPESDAISRTCGPIIPPSAWVVERSRDSLTGAATAIAYNSSRVHDLERAYRGDPELAVACADDLLAIVVWNGGEFIGLYGSSVAFRFNDGPVIEQVWDNDPDGVYVVQPSNLNRGFINGLREEGALTFRTWDYNGSQVGTIEFSLAGVGLDVEPVLQECGY